MKPKILIVCPHSRDTREIARTGLDKDYDIIFDPLTASWTSNLEAAIAENKSEINSDNLVEQTNSLHNYYTDAIDGVCSSDDYPGSIVSSIVAKELGFAGPSPESVMRCQNKFISRGIAQNTIPYATPRFICTSGLLDIQKIDFGLPWFVKPVKSFFSHGSSKVLDRAALPMALSHANLHQTFLEPFLNWSEIYLKSNRELTILVEEFISGFQVTVEGFVYQHSVHITGIVDSIMFPGTNIFERFIYPSSLDESIQERMRHIAQQLVHELGFNNSLFNIGMIYDPATDRMIIIEINPRMSSQFADLFEKANGVNSYEYMLLIAANRNPFIKNKKGKFQLAASVVLRTFKNYFVKKVPSAIDVQRVSDLFPETCIEILVSQETMLGSQLQDGQSYRYGLINLGAQDHRELEYKVNTVKQMLPFEFS